MSATHDPNINIVITLDAAPAPQAGFSKVLHLVPLATNSLAGSRMVTYGNISEVQSDQTSGFVDAETVAAATVAFSQSPKPTEFAVGYIDLVGGETYAEAIQACMDYSDTFYGVTMRSRDAADIVDASTAVEALSKLFFAQNGNSDWLTPGVPAGLASIVSHERTAVHYHDETTEYQDVAHAVKFLVFDPDVQSAPAHLPVGGVAAYTTAITSGQRTNIIDNNANAMLPYGGSSTYIDPGKALTARSLYEMLTADWLEIRLQQDIAVMIVNHSNRGEKVTLDALGQAKVLNIIKARLQQGVQASHFVAGQTNVRALSITASDYDAERLRFEGEAQLAVAGRKVDLNFAVGRNPVNVEA